MNIRWEYDNVNKWYNLYINDEYMGLYDRYEYERAKKVIRALGH